MGHAEPALAFEALALEHGEDGVVEKRARGRSTLDVLGVAFDDAAAEAANLIEGAFKRDGSDTPLAIVAVNKEASDPPVWKLSQPLLIGLLQLDAWEFIGRDELAPTNSGRTVVHEGGMCVTRPDQTLLFNVVWWMGLRFTALYVKGHAPAPTPHAIVLFHQACEIGPGRFVEEFDSEDGGRSVPPL